MNRPVCRRTLLRTLLAWPASAGVATAWGSDELPATIDRIRPSVQAVGFYKETQNPRFAFRGTAFAVADGSLMVTNAHVVQAGADLEAGALLMVNIRDATGNDNLRAARVVESDPTHDLALLRVEGAPLPPLRLRKATDPPVREGQAVAFTGYPAGALLGFAPVTHRGMVSAIRPVALPSPTAGRLDARTISRLREGAFNLYQLDATAYPGNSGGPLFDAASGLVIGVVNMVTLKSTRESALSQPSGISYAIPVDHVQDLLARALPR